jgi:hypothetical protein
MGGFFLPARDPAHQHGQPEKVNELPCESSGRRRGGLDVEETGGEAAFGDHRGPARSLASRHRLGVA